MKKYLFLVLLLFPCLVFGQTQCPGEEWAVSTVSFEETTLEFANRLPDENIKIYWIAPTQERQLRAELLPGQNVVQETFVGHPWVVTDDKGNCLNVYYGETAPRTIRVANREDCDDESLPERAYLESPVQDSDESGIGIIRGWVCCDAGTVEVVIDDGEFVLEAPHGSRRADTEKVCGDVDNGFGLTFNWNELEDGMHNIRTLVDGVEFGNATFSVKTLDQDSVKLPNARYTVRNFPDFGEKTLIGWSVSNQNFVIVGE